MSTISSPAGSSLDLTLPAPGPELEPASAPDPEPAREPDVAAAPVVTAGVRVEAVRWSLATRLAFRFSVVYFTVYVICTQMLYALFIIPVTFSPPDFARLPPMRQMTVWVAQHVIGVQGTVLLTQSGSGDKTFDWAQVIVTMGLAGLATILWSILARSRTSHPGVYKWYRLFLRFAVATTMASYGMIKLVPLQMPAPSLTRLLEPFGNFSPMGVLWASIGASKSYEMFAGGAEVVAAILLFIPVLSRVGALVCFGVVLQIFVLNMTYDVPVKLFSFHLLVMCVFLMAPDIKRLVHLLILNRAVEPSPERPLVASRRGRWILVAVQLVFATYIIGMNWARVSDGARQFGGAAPKPALFGIWEIERMTIDGVERAPLVTDYDRFRRVLVGMRKSVSFQRMDSTFENQTAEIDMNAKTMALSKPAVKDWGTFTFQQPAPDRLVLDGTIQGRPMRMETRLVDHTKFLLLSRGFNWIQEQPFNR